MPLPPQALLVLPPACRQSGSHQDPTTLSTYDSLASPTNLWAPSSNDGMTDESPFSGHSPQVRTRLSIVVCSLLNKSWYQATTTLSELSTPQPLGDDPLASLCFLNRSSLVLDFGIRQCMCSWAQSPGPWSVFEESLSSPCLLKINPCWKIQGLWISFFCLFFFFLPHSWGLYLTTQAHSPFWDALTQIPLRYQSKWPVPGTLYPDILWKVCNILVVIQEMEKDTLSSSFILSLFQILSLLCLPVPLLSYESY